MPDAVVALSRPDRVYSRREVLNRDSPVSHRPGLYAWFFRTIPSIVPTDDCVRWNELVLLYVGISPKEPPRNGKPPSKENLWSRVRYHMQGNAEGSTLRLSLGCLLSDTLGIELRRVGSGKRFTFGHRGEARLSAWMDENAFVTWLEHPSPWEAEPQVIRSLSLPLNLDHNKDHPFCARLKDIRAAARKRARELPISDE